MNSIPEEGDQGRWRERIAPTSSVATTSDDRNSSSSDGYESDWEKEISADGDVFYVAAVNTREEELRQQQVQHGPEIGSGTKKSGKLSRLVRRRESKRDRYTPAKSQNGSQQQQESSDNDSSTYYGQLKTFESVFESTNPVEMLEISLRIKGRKSSSVDPLHSLVEQMMGIIPVRDPAHNKKESDSGEWQHLSNVVVAGYVPDGPASKISDKLLVGDVIRLVDGQQVNLATIEQLLSTYSSSTKVKLTVQRPTKLLPDPISPDENSSSNGSMAAGAPLTGLSEKKARAALGRLTCIVLYLSRTGLTESSPEMADVLYQFPSPAHIGDQATKLLKARGVFVTLAQILPQISVSRPLCSSVSVNGELVHIGYATGDGEDDSLLLAFPSSQGCSAADAARAASDVARVLRLCHGSLSNAFRTANRRSTDQFFRDALMGEVMAVTGAQNPAFDSSTIGSPRRPLFEQVLPAAHWLNLPDEVKFQIDDAMNQFESADFQDFSEEFYCLPREFNILGSCVFHKGFLLASHLSREDLVDVLLWCRYKNLLNLTSTTPVHQVVAWNEFFRTTSHVPQSTAGPPTRTFLLVVGLGYQILGALLQTGGCTAQMSSGISVKPDPFYVDQAMNTLEHLEEMGLPIVCARWLTLPSNPAVVNVNQLYRSAAKRMDANALGSASKMLPEKGIVLRRTKSLHHSTPSCSSSSASESDDAEAKRNEGSEGSGEELRTAFREEEDAKDLSRSDEDTSTWELRRSGQRSRISYNDSASAKSSSDEFVTFQVSQLPICFENTLFHYISLDCVGDAVYLAPLKRGEESGMHSELLDNFRASCALIRSTLLAGVRSAQSALTSEGRPWASRALVAAREQSLLCQWSPRGQPTLSYWVSGRLLTPSLRECYVCYHESAPQMAVELAFRLAFGAQL